jgi:dTDP-4-dehydrorhamnose reductase
MMRTANEHVAVLGAGGMLGYAMVEFFSRRGSTVTALRRQDYDIAADPIDALEPLVRSANVIINCAGVIKPLIARTPLEDVLRVNSMFPRNLALLGERLGIRTFHVTTDCVYTGRKGQYRETDYFDADDVYGISKNGGDVGTNMLLRTSIVGEENGQARSLLEWARSQRGKKVNGFLNHRWNGVTTVHLAEVIARILDEDLYQRGVFHIHSPEPVTKFELLGLMSDAYDLKLDIQQTNADVFCDRTLASNHDLSRRLCTKGLRQQLLEMRAFFEAAPTLVRSAEADSRRARQP